MIELILKEGREHAIGRHPWIFSGAIERLTGEPERGETVKIVTYHGEPFAFAAYSPASSIRARIWTYDTNEVLDENYIEDRLKKAIEKRSSLLDDPQIDSCRLVYGESDGFPGLIVDKYADYLCLQIVSAGAERWRNVIVDLLGTIIKPEGIYERSDVEVRNLEGLEPQRGPLAGKEPPHLIKIKENGLHFMVNVRSGQKTGFYLDQRVNRQIARKYVEDCDILDAYCYTGGFTLNAATCGAKSVHSLDSSEEALEILRENLSLNRIPADIIQLEKANVSEKLRRFRDMRKSFDTIILDPPKFAPTAALLESALRGYKDINLMAMKLLKPGGILITFSCSSAVDIGKFNEMLGLAASDAGVTARILEFLSQPTDHPIILNFPESNYLKGCVLKID